MDFKQRLSFLKAKASEFMAAFAFLNFLENRNLEAANFRDHRPVPTLFFLTDEEKKEREEETQKEKILQTQNPVPASQIPSIGISPGLNYSSKICYDTKIMKETPHEKELKKKIKVCQLLNRIADSVSDKKVKRIVQSQIERLYSLNEGSAVDKVPVDPLHPLAAAELFFEIGKPAVPHLMEALSDVEIGNIAVQALGKINDPSIVPKLMELIKSSGFEAESAAKALVMAGVDEAQFKQLVEMAYENNPTAAKALELIGNDQAKKALLEVLKRTGSFVAAKALVEFREFDAIPIMVDRMRNIIFGDSDLHSFLRRCNTKQDIEKFESRLQEGCDLLFRRKDIPFHSKIQLARLRKSAANRKNKLAQAHDKGILLEDRPKPPKSGTIYQQARRIRNV
jgi:hypothetical protein